MRRMFQGRMITVPGCSKRMQANWNLYCINTDDDRGYIFSNSSQGGAPNPKRLYAEFNVVAGQLYRIEVMNSNYDVCVFNPGTSPVSQVLGWVKQGSFTAPESGIISVIIASDGEHTEDVNPGDCGAIITKY